MKWQHCGTYQDRSLPEECAFLLNARKHKRESPEAFVERGTNENAPHGEDLGCAL
ncbi:Uncharacterized protein DAT39_017096, partial [Clarias magur]